jgi:hypothetical protein
VSHGTRQSDSPFLSRLSPACPCLWLPQRRWCAVSILEDHLAGVFFLAGGSIPKRVRNSRCTVVTVLVFANCSIQNAFCCKVAILQHGLPWRRLPETLSRVNYKQTLRVFLTIDAYCVIVGSLVTWLQTCESVTFFLNCPVHQIVIRSFVLLMRYVGKRYWTNLMLKRYTRMI